MAMENTSNVCCMCGDVGFPDKLFRCTQCLHRHQHSYCRSYCDTVHAGFARLCDWCLSEQRSCRVTHGDQPEKPVAEKSVDKIKQADDQEEIRRSKGKNTSASSSKTSSRRYKLLKDVLC